MAAPPPPLRIRSPGSPLSFFLSEAPLQIAQMPQPSRPSLASTRQFRRHRLPKGATSSLRIGERACAVARSVLISEIIKFPIGERLSEGSAAGARFLRITQKTRAAKCTGSPRTDLGDMRILSWGFGGLRVPDGKLHLMWVRLEFSVCDSILASSTAPLGA